MKNSTLTLLFIMMISGSMAQTEWQKKILSDVQKLRNEVAENTAIMKLKQFPAKPPPPICNDSTICDPWIDAPFRSWEFVAFDGVWDVDASDIITNRYKINGTILHWSIYIVTTTTDSSAIGLRMTIPEGTIGGHNFKGIGRGSALGMDEVVNIESAQGTDYIQFTRFNASLNGFPDQVNNVDIRASITMEIQ